MMKFSTYNFKDDFNSEKDLGKTIYSGSGLTVETYHLKKDTSVLNNYETDNVINGEHIVVYLVVDGKLEVRFDEQKFDIGAGESMRIKFDRNFSCWALEDTNFFAVHNCVEPEVDNTPAALVEAVHQVELNDAYLKGHNYRVGKYSTLIMQAMDPERSTTKFHMAAAYHDVGKVGVPSEILNKNGRLTDEEFAAIKKHPALSYEMLEPFIGKEAAEFARWHHEKLDGSGYPDGISGDKIPLESRIMAVVDIFDALTTDRCYRSGFSFKKAMDILEEDVNAGKLDAEVYAVLKKMIDNGIILEGVDNIYKDANSIMHYDGFTIDDIRKEQEKRRLVTETAELYRKMSEKLMETLALAALYIDLEEGTYKWIACKDKRLEGIENYAELGMRYSSFMPEDDAKRFLELASMDKLTEVFKTQSEHSFTVTVFDEEGNPHPTTMLYTAVDESRRYILGVSRN